MATGLTQEQFDSKRLKVHGDKYKCLEPYPGNNRTKLRFSCLEHGEFLQTADSHLSGRGCHKCARVSQAAANRISEEEWDRRRREVHGDKYECLDEFRGMHYKVTLLCQKHGAFKMKPMAHLPPQSSGCPQCASRKLSQQEFVQKCFETHGGKYKCLDEYKGDKIKLRFVCEEHGVFEQSPRCHLNGNGCKQCFVENRRISQEEFDRRRFEMHGERYKCLDPLPKSRRTKMRFVCEKHGIFKQDSMCHLQGQGCRKCAYDQRALNRKLSEEEWQRRRKEVHGDRYKCLDPYVNDYTKLRFICPDHGEFKMAPMAHMRQGQGCPSCSESRGEQSVDEALKKFGLVLNVDYFKEYRFDDCRKKRTLPFDFYIPSLNLLIEYDGELHFRAPDNNAFGGKEGLAERQENDQIKNEYCKTNNIKLVRIPYTHFNEIETILDFVLEDLKLAA